MFNLNKYEYFEDLNPGIMKYMPVKKKILDVGCGKAFLLYDFTKVVPDLEIHGIDVSEYAYIKWR